MRGDSIEMRLICSTVYDLSLTVKHSKSYFLNPLHRVIWAQQIHLFTHLISENSLMNKISTREVQVN